MSFDITETLAPASDQLDAIELAAGPRVFTVASVSKGSLEQPVQIHFTDFPRPWRPSKSMRRVLAACWGAESSVWTGHKAELFFDPEVTFGKDKPGGTRIKALSHIDKPVKVPLLIARGKSAMYVVEPLIEAPTVDIATINDPAVLRGMWKASDKTRQAQIEARVAELAALAEPV